MSKLPIDCLKCGGTHEDNPSGRLRHARTAKHKAAMAETFVNIDPAKPILIPGGHPRTDAESQATREDDKLRLAIAQAQVDLDKAQHDLDYRNKPKHLHQFGDRSRRNFENRIADLKEQIRLWEDARATFKNIALGQAEAREAADAEMYAAVELYVTTLFSGNSTIWIRRNGKDFTVHGVTGKVQTVEQMGETFELPETVFGHEATAYGPDLGWYSLVDRSQAIKPAYVSWSTTQMPTLADAERLLEIHRIAIEVAHLLNELAGIES